MPLKGQDLLYSKLNDKQLVQERCIQEICALMLFSALHIPILLLVPASLGCYVLALCDRDCFVSAGISALQAAIDEKEYV